MFRAANRCNWLKTVLRSRTAQVQRQQSTFAEAAVGFNPGQELHGYTVQRVVPVHEFHLTAILLQHEKTGAEHLHIARDDADNAFAVAFRTTPMDSTGVPHILEHTALCGSEKFPVRDPFFKMLNRSLATFMNAMTSYDWTIYPFSSQNSQDYRNLMSVYLDAVFNPRLAEMDFSQEGWRLEHENVEDKNSPIIFKGIVFNEMKGVFSNPQHWFSEKSRNLLHPSHTYSVVYGGDPEYIPDLTWKQLKDFHTTHYHPSNAKFYTYGNFPLDSQLQYINENFLKGFHHIDPNTSVPLESRWTSPKEEKISCAADPMAPDPNKQTTISVNFLLTDITDTYESLVLNIIGALLTTGEKSPFYQSLLEANIGSDFAPTTGFDGHTREATFSIGLQGIHKDDIGKVKQIVAETFKKVENQGFEPERIEAILHKIEIQQRHQADKFGLFLGFSLMPAWNHGGDPIAALQVQKLVDRFKDAMKGNPRYLQDKVKQYFDTNAHSLTLVMSPDEKFEQQRQEKEAAKLQAFVSNLSEQDRETIYQKGKELATLQMQKQDVSCLPTLKVSDIEQRPQPVETNTAYAGNVPVQMCAQPTNGMVYFNAISSISQVPEELKPYIPLFCNVVTRMGAGGLDYKDLSQQIELKTGGMSASVHLAEHHSQDRAFEQGILFSSNCLERNTNSMFELWSQIFHSLDLSDKNRLTTLVLMTAAEMANSLADAGHNFALTHASSSLAPVARLSEEMTGITQVGLMKRVAEMKDLTCVVEHLQEISQCVLNREALRCAINATPEFVDSASQSTEVFVTNLYHPQANKPDKMTDCQIFTVDSHFNEEAHQTHFELPFQVNYMGRSVRTVPYTHTDFASLRILGRLMSAKYLHREIREKGGAYGGSATGGNPGLFNFLSYRDPNSMKTLEVFDKAVDWAVQGGYSQQDIDEAKLSVFSKVDSPVPPGSRGLRLFMLGIDDTMKQHHRQQLFGVDKDDLVRVAKQYLAPESRISSVSFLGPENAATKDNPQWTVRHQS